MGDTGAVGSPQQVKPTAVTPTLAAPPTGAQQAAPPATVAAPPKDESHVAASGSAPSQVALVDPAAETAVTAAPPQPGVEEPDPVSPKVYKRPPVEVVDAFGQNFGRRLLPARSGEALAGQVLQTLGIDPRDEGAVRRLQKRVGAYPDGKFGPETWGRAISYLNARSEKNDPAAQQAMALLLTPTGTGGGNGAAQHAKAPKQKPAAQPPAQPPQAQQPAAVDPAIKQTAEAPPAATPPDPNAEAYAKAEEKFIEMSSNSMDKQIEDSWFWSTDTVAKNNINNPASLAAMRPSTVAKQVGSLMSGWTSGDDQKAILVAMRSQANMGAGKLGQTFTAMGGNFKDLAGEITDAQRKELITMAQAPGSGVTPEQLKALQDG